VHEVGGIVQGTDHLQRFSSCTLPAT
jgi:hypothetical protein